MTSRANIEQRNLKKLSRTMFWLVLAFVTISVFMSAATAYAATPNKCAKRSTYKTVIQNQKVWVYEDASSDDFDVTHACFKRTGKTMSIDKRLNRLVVGFLVLEKYKLANRYLAISWYGDLSDGGGRACTLYPNCDPSNNAGVTVFDVKTRKVFTNLYTTDSTGRESFQVTTNGTLFVAAKDLRRGENNAQGDVQVVESKASQEKILDSGNIDPKSLKIVGKTVRWIKEGSSMSAPT